MDGKLKRVLERQAQYYARNKRAARIVDDAIASSAIRPSNSISSAVVSKEKFDEIETKGYFEPVGAEKRLIL